MEWIHEAESVRFEVGDRVTVNGTVAKGEGFVFCAHYFDKETKRRENGGGEISYLFKVFEPFPQIGVRLDDGEDWHFNAEDLLAGKITLIERPEVTPEMRVGINPFSGDISIDFK